MKRTRFVPPTLFLLALLLAIQAPAPSHAQPVVVSKPSPVPVPPLTRGPVAIRSVRVDTAPSRPDLSASRETTTVPFHTGASVRAGVHPDTPEAVAAKAGSGGLAQANIVLGRSFDGTTGATSGGFPGDPALAVGPPTDTSSTGYVVETLNFGLKIYDKTGRGPAMIPFAGGPNALFSPTASDRIFDARILYDRYDGHFVVVALETRAAPNLSRIHLAFSATSDPTGTWFSFATDATASAAPAGSFHSDFISLALDGQAIYTATDRYTFPNDQTRQLIGIKYRVFNKAAVYGQAPTWADWDEVTGTASGPWAMRAVQTLDGKKSDPPVGVFIGSDAAQANSSVLYLRKIKDPLSWPIQAAQVRTFQIKVPSYRPPLADAPQGPLCSAPDLDVLSGQLLNAVSQSGRIYTAHGIHRSQGSDIRTVARWYSIVSGPPETPAWWAHLEQSGEIDPGPGRFAFFPAIGATASSDVAVVFAVSSANEAPGIWITGRSACDPPGSMAPIQQLRSGNACFTDPGGNNPGRWGDYFDIARAPDKPEELWINGKFSFSTTDWRSHLHEIDIQAVCEPCRCKDGNGGGGGGPVIGPPAQPGDFQKSESRGAVDLQSTHQEGGAS